MGKVLFTSGWNQLVESLLKVNGIDSFDIIIETQRDKKERRQGVVFGVLKWFLKRVSILKPTLKEIAIQNGLKHFYFDGKNYSELLLFLSQENAQLGIVYSMPFLIKTELINFFKGNLINIHPSLLPKYRGPEPWFWQYYFFERLGGVTFHYIDEGEDTGAILFQLRYEISVGMDSWHMQKLAIGELAHQGVMKIVRAFDRNETIEVKKQSKHQTFRARRILDNEHAILIDWINWQPDHVYHVLNGTWSWLNPIPMPKGVLFKAQRWKFLKYYDKKNIIDKDYQIVNSFFGIRKKLIFKNGVIVFRPRLKLTVLLSRFLK